MATFETGGHVYPPRARLADLLYTYGDGRPLRDLVVFSDSDWAGDKVTRRSASREMLTLDGTPLALIRRGQGVRAQSSAEAQVYAGVMGIKESLQPQELLGWLGELVRGRLGMDTSAGRSVFSRIGVGRNYSTLGGEGALVAGPLAEGPRLDRRWMARTTWRTWALKR
jgi:hypothetical protein